MKTNLDQIKAGADIHAGDGGYKLGTQEEYEAFVKDRNQSLAKSRIQELAKQATNYIDPTINEGVCWELDQQKFAELIVRECIEQGKQIQLQTVSNGSKDYVDGREMGIEVFMNQIKQHFGVEE